MHIESTGLAKILDFYGGKRKGSLLVFLAWERGWMVKPSKKVQKAGGRISSMLGGYSQVWDLLR